MSAVVIAHGMMVAVAKDSGFVKFEVTPGGGLRAGTLSKIEDMMNARDRLEVSSSSCSREESKLMDCLSDVSKKPSQKGI